MSWEDEDDNWDNAGNSDGEDKEKGGNTGGGGDLWDGEDEDDDTLLGEDWDADDKPKEEGKTVVPGAKKLTKRQLAKKVEEAEAERERLRLAIVNMSDEDRKKAKEQERKKIERDIVKDAGDLFGDMGELEIEDDVADDDNDNDNATLSADTIAACSTDEPKGVEDVKLVSADDFTKFAKLVGDKVASSINTKKRGDSKKLVDFLKIIISSATASMDLDDCNTVKKHFNLVYNQKAKDPSKKKKKNTKKTVKLGSGGGGGGYDDMYDDYY